jgi:PAS domain S-box-containing protein
MPRELHDTIAAAVLDSVSDAVVASDRDGRIVFWNPGAERIFGHTAEEALGQSLNLVVPERLRERHWQGFRRVMETGESRYGAGDVLAVPGERKDGSRVSLEFTIVPLAGEGGRLKGLVAVMRDVTPRFEEMKALKRRLATG